MSLQDLLQYLEYTSFIFHSAGKDTAIEEVAESLLVCIENEIFTRVKK